MKKVILLALSLTAAGYTAQAQAMKAANATEKVAGPQIVFEETKYEFKPISQGEVVDHVFKFKNTGTQPLVINNIGVSCGCTTPEWTKDPVAPGKSGTIAAHFNSAGKMGMQNKVLTVESNSVGGSTTVSLVGEVKEATTAAAPAAMPMESKMDMAPAKEKEKADGMKLKEKKKKA